MSDKKPDQEPSIEEILASIRQIISDEDGGGGASSPDPAPAAPEPPANDDIIDLTDKVEPDPLPEPDPVPAFLEESVEEDLPAPEPEPEPVHVDLRDQEEEPVLPEPEPESFGFDDVPQAAEESPDSILTDRAAGAALAAFSKLTGSMPIRSPDSPGQGTLEDIVRDMLRPMLRAWLDENLPPIIEKLVRRELEKLARQAMEG